MEAGMEVEMEDVAGDRGAPTSPGVMSKGEVDFEGLSDEEDSNSDDDIMLSGVRLTNKHSRKEYPFSALVKENRERLGIVREPTHIAVHNLSFSLEIVKARSATRTIWHDIRERWNVEKKEKVTKNVLKNVSFVVREKMMVLVLGPPGCGKTSIMKLLSNSMAYGRANGDIYFNKAEIDPDSHHQMVSYVTQEDVHTPFLTVRETLEFAGNCLLDRKGKAMEDVEVSDIADVVMQLLGLSHRADTIVGNDMVRGVSGGEKRRVSIGIEMMKKPRFLLLDEATTGLDTTRSVELGTFCRIIADAYVPVVAALLQPPYKLYKKFDHILLMHKGRVAYFGKRKDVLAYFEGIGFRCPGWMNPADFLVSILIRPDEFRIDGAPVVVETDEEFADAYALSSLYNDVILPMIRESFPEGLQPEEEPPLSTSSSLKRHQEIDPTTFSGKRDWTDDRAPSYESSRTPKLTMKDAISSYPPDRPAKFYNSKFEQFVLLTKRGFRCTKNFPQLNIFLLFYSLFLGLFYGTLFLQLGDNQVDIQLKAGVVFNIVMVIGLQANKSNDTHFQERPLFLYQRAKRYFSTFPYFLACLVNTIPGMAMNVTLFGTVAYWMAGLTAQNHGGRFFFLILIGILLQLCTDGWVRFIAQLNSSYITAQGIAPLSIAIFILFAGFFRKIEEIPWAVRWISYVDPFRWAYEASVINELGGQEFECDDDELVPPLNDPLLFLPFSAGGYEGNRVCPITEGDDALTGLGLKDEQSWKWFCLLFIISLLVTFQTLYLIALKFIMHEKPEMIRLKDFGDDTEGEWLMDVKKEVGEYSEESLEERRNGKPRVVVEAKDLCYSVQIVKDPHKDEEKNTDDVEDEEDDIEDEEEPLRKKSKDETQREVRGEGGFSDVGLWNKLSQCLPNTKKKLSGALPCAGGEKDWLMLLENVQMKASPGQLVALMGPSGAGKSTLMDVVAGRKTGGKIEGDISYGGKPRDGFFSRYTGYCEQQNLHVEYATVWEAVRLAAITRLPESWSREEKLANVKYVIERLRLESVAHILVKYLRLEQKKRLTVAVELVTNPSVMFLDEPTSGLDATEASEIIRVVKEEAEKGMSVVCTIHQPSAQIFSLFSHVLILRKGGKMVYNGKVEDMASYFESEMGAKMPKHENPADFGLDMASIQYHSHEEDPATIWDNYCIKRDQDQPRSGGNEDDAEDSLSEDSPLLTYDSKYPASFLTQTKELTLRSVKAIFRRPQDFRVRIFRSIILGLLAGGVFYDAGDGQTGPNTRVSSFYFLLLVATFNSFTQIALIILDRPSFYRERLSGSYRALAYLLALMIPDIPFQLLSFLLYALPQYFMIGLRIGVEEIFYYMIVGFGAFILCFCLVNLIAVVAFSAPVATLLGGVTISIANLLAGFFIPFNEIPNYWIWAYYISFVRYPLEGLTVNELTDQAFNCGPDGTDGAVPVPVDGNVQFYCPITNGNQVIESYSMDSDHQWPWMAVTYGFTFAFVALTLVALVKIIHLNR